MALYATTMAKGEEEVIIATFDFSLQMRSKLGMKSFIQILLILSTTLFIEACGVKRSNVQTNDAPTPIEMEERNNTIPQQGEPLGLGSQALRPIVVYATRADYNTMVPITLDTTKKYVISYPHCNDLRLGNGYTLPIALENGLLLDRRGISMGTAFLSLTYEHYCSFDQPLSPEELQKYVLDNDPLTFLAICDRNRLRDESLEAINDYIREGLPGAKIIIDRREKSPFKGEKKR